MLGNNPFRDIFCHLAEQTSYISSVQIAKQSHDNVETTTDEWFTCVHLELNYSCARRMPILIRTWWLYSVLSLRLRDIIS